PHGAGEPEFPEVAAAPLQGLDERTAREGRSEACDIEAVSCRTERLLDQCGRVGRVLREERQRFGRESGALQRIESLRRPCDILKCSDSETPGVDLDHGV